MDVVQHNKDSRYLGTTDRLIQRTQYPSRIHRRISRSPTLHVLAEKGSPSYQNAKHNQVITTRILILFVLSIAYVICIMTVIGRRRKRRIEEAQRISLTTHPSRPLHPMSQEAVVI